MEKLTLGPRLAALAAFSAQARKPVDVGTDHGYLPVWLLENAGALEAIATDIHEKPLRKAIDCARAHGLADRITFVRTDGLEGVDLSSVDTIVIAGMGGETIQSILARVPGLPASRIRLVLQPITKIELLIRWLYSAGFHIEDERLAEEAGALYRILSVTGGAAKMPDEAELLAGEALYRNKDPLLGEYLRHLFGQLSRKRDGLLRAAAPETRAQAGEVEALARELERRRREWL